MRPEDPGLALYWDRARLKTPTDEACDQFMVEYAARRMKALDKDNTHKAVGILPTREYKSRLAASKALTGASSTERCRDLSPATGKRCLKKSHPPTEAHRF